MEQLAANPTPCGSVGSHTPRTPDTAGVSKIAREVRNEAMKKVEERSEELATPNNGEGSFPPAKLHHPLTRPPPPGGWEGGFTLQRSRPRRLACLRRCSLPPWARSPRPCRRRGRTAASTTGVPRSQRREAGVGRGRGGSSVALTRGVVPLLKKPQLQAWPEQERSVSPSRMSQSRRGLARRTWRSIMRMKIDAKEEARLHSI